MTILFIVALFLIHHRQQARRRRFNEPPPTEGILFEDAVDIQLLDKNLLFAFKGFLLDLKRWVQYNILPSSGIFYIGGVLCREFTVDF